MYEEGKKWFEYTLADAWHTPLTSITVLNGENNVVIYSVSEQDMVPGRMQSVQIDDAVMEKVKRTIMDSKAYEFDGVEENRDYIVMDGYVQMFYVSDGQNYSEVEAFNLDTYNEDARRYPKATALKTLLKKLSRILVPVGVDRRCLELVDE